MVSQVAPAGFMVTELSRGRNHTQIWQKEILHCECPMLKTNNIN